MKRKPNGSGSIYYDEKRKRFIAKLRCDGIRKTFTGKTEQEAQFKMLEYQNSSLSPIIAGYNYTLREWCLKWFTTYKINDYKKCTYDKELRRLKNILSDSIGDLHLRKIKPLDIQEYINRRNKSPKTIKNEISLLSGAFKQAINENMIASNPCSAITVPKNKKADMVALTSSDKELFLDINKEDKFIDIYRFALATGMRISEICGLTKDSVDLVNGYITIDKQLVRIKGECFLDSPKTKQSIRKVPLNSTSKKILSYYIEHSPLNFVFYNPNTNGQLFQNVLSRHCHQCFIKAYTLTKRDVYSKANFHSFRHTFATQWLLQGGNVNLLSKCLGHTDPAFTQRVYVQPDYSDVFMEMSKLSF